MQTLEQAVDAVVGASPWRVVFSSPKKGTGLRRASIVAKRDGYQVERLSETQAFHQNIAPHQLAEAVADLLGQFSQLTAFSPGRQQMVRISKKGTVLYQSAKSDEMPPQSAEHDRQKKSLLPAGQAIAPLVDIGVLTADGRPVAAKRDKLRQINRFVELVDDALPTEAPRVLRVVDFGCGKSYLTFVLYHYLTQVRGIEAEMLGLDLKADVVAGCNAAAQRYGYQTLRFAQGQIDGYRSDEPVDMVVTLHACDTATDDALAKAVQWGAGYIFSVPCCQHELNAQIKSEELELLCRYGLVKERVAALMTDAVRANLLVACGYKTQLVEFVEMEHTPKNIMIRAVRAKLPLATRQKALREVQRLCEAFSLSPSLLRQLQAGGYLPAL